MNVAKCFDHRSPQCNASGAGFPFAGLVVKSTCYHSLMIHSQTTRSMRTQCNLAEPWCFAMFAVRFIEKDLLRNYMFNNFDGNSGDCCRFKVNGCRVKIMDVYCCSTLNHPVNEIRFWPALVLTRDTQCVISLSFGIKRKITSVLNFGTTIFVTS